MNIIDFHNHLMPGVDDGARAPEDTRGAIRAFRAAGIGLAVATPHFDASLTRDSRAFELRMAELERGWGELQAVAAQEGFEVRRGAEVALDIPGADLSDPRVRLGGTRFVLVEFAFMTVPPNSPDVLANIRAGGWIPVLAHPERYGRLQSEPELAAAWRSAGACLQVNGASLLGRYGAGSRQAALELLAAGRADFICSDYHTRGAPGTAEYRAVIEERGGSEQAMLLLELNPRRLLQDELPLPVPPLQRERGLWRRMKRLLP